LTQVAKSAINMEKPPSPAKAMHCRPGYAIWGGGDWRTASAHPMDARVPDTECICPFLTGICRAHQLVTGAAIAGQNGIVPEGRFAPIPGATTCGFIGLSVLVPSFSINSRPGFHAVSGPCFEENCGRTGVCKAMATSPCKQCRQSPTRPTSTGRERKPIRLGSTSICTTACLVRLWQKTLCTGRKIRP